MSSELEQIDPSTAVEMYIRDRENELSQATVYSHRSRLSHFTRWCEQKSIEEMHELSGLNLHEYRLWRREEGELNSVTEKTQMDTLRVFIRWCESVDAVEANLSEKVLSPSLSKGENERDEMVDPDVIRSIIDYLEKYEYASTDHVTLLLMWRCLLRRGAVRAIDLGDAHLDADEPYIEIHHRPETDTPLKNQDDAEREIGLKSKIADVMQDYVQERRQDVIDAHGREPLVSTKQGRPHATTVAATAYAVTRPCTIGAECPHGRELDECDAARDRQQAYECPSSKSPHPIRRGAITAWLRADVPDTVVGDRASTSPEVLDKHYDERTEHQKMQQRRRYLNNV